MKTRRFTKPLDSAGPRGSFTMTPGMAKCLDGIAAAYGVSTAEILRRFTARGIVDTAPAELGQLGVRARSEIETLAYLGGTEND